MALQLDTLRNNDVCVIYNTTNGKISEFYEGDDFVKVLKRWGVEADKILDYFTAEEIVDFFLNNAMELESLTDIKEIRMELGK